MKITRFWPSTVHLWLCAFRPFFLLASAHAIVAMAWWLGSLAGLLPLPALPGGTIVWHAHEMIFGFASAAVAGFLLTAIVKFTGTPAVDRKTVQLLLGLWLGGRLFYLLAEWLGVLPAAFCDLAFLLLLIACIAGPLWRQPGRRHLAFFNALCALAAVHAGFYLTLWRGGDAMPWLLLAVGLMMLLIVIALSRISMRLVNDVLEHQGGITAPYLARPPRRNLAMFTIAAFSVSEFLLPANTVSGWLALAAAAAIFNLLNDWHVGRALWQRWVLIPYLGYWAMALGYAVIGVGLLSGSNWRSAGHHLLLVGAMALLVLIVMSAAGRVHSGHGLDHRRWLPAAAALLFGAGLLRAAASLPAIMTAYTPLLYAAATPWLLAWSIYLIYSWTALSGPRPDGRQGCDETA
ncbi:NnrS family protein [Rhodoferax antarcticus]|uniref:NnrS family protein n=1 Tax=Rhodoferax antarcticus ANT.BR TaxID=1111071 RepID=A0A1Q8YC56_9BURK|nr:NnrS family protein [Rhodoferax antarcticus]APW46562.1 hypothetical protein RA876_09480 [Rhodoferax antarcticus]MCW2313620.1 uncharacterized protein involved in response to NO [Rhodoferax antarcticus]OLP05628.1 nnrS family protein [Rhodoferax antarcticus ANT.BR]